MLVVTNSRRRRRGIASLAAVNHWVVDGGRSMTMYYFKNSSFVQ
jgi:hypothetical protein